jgi:ribonuclease VapC
VIAVDTSALVAILFGEPEAEACKARLAAETEIVISAGTVAEALIVAERRAIGTEMRRLLDEIGLGIIPVSAAAAWRAAAAYARWGRGVHSAALNFGDCFAYEVAAHHGCPLLYVGNDFAQTDLQPAL